MRYNGFLIKKAVILFSVLLVSELSSGQQVLDHLLKARAYNKAGDAGQSVQILTDAIGKNKDYRLLIERAEANILRGNHSEAIADFTAANDLYSLSGEYGLAKVYAIKGDAATSIYHLELSMKSDFKKSEKEIMLDPVFSRIENRSEWRQFWQKDWYSIPEKSLSEIEFYSSAGKVEDASAVLNELGKIYPGSETTKYAGSLVDLSAGRYTSAVKTLTGLLASEPRNEKYLRALAKGQEALGNWAGASLTYTSLLNMDVADADLLIQRAECYSKTSEAEKALADVNKYLTLYPKDRNALSLAGKYSAVSGDNLGAMKYFSENLKNNPNDPQCYIDRANSYLSARSWDWAVNDYAMALDLDPDNSETWLSKGIALLNAGKMEDACHDFMKAFSLGNKRATEYISKHCIK